MDRRRSRRSLPPAAHGGRSQRGVVYVYINTRGGAAGRGANVDHPRENAALGRDGVRRRRRGDRRIGDPILQAGAKVSVMLRIRVWTTLACLCALGASAAARGDSVFRVRILDETA